MIRRKPEDIKYEFLKKLYGKLRKKQDKLSSKVEKLKKDKN